MFQAKIPCSGNCKCIGCRNIEEPILEKKSLKDLAEAAEVRTSQLSLNKAQLQLSEMAFRPPASSNTGTRLVTIFYKLKKYFKDLSTVCTYICNIIIKINK